MTKDLHTCTATIGDEEMMSRASSEQPLREGGGIRAFRDPRLIVPARIAAIALSMILLWSLFAFSALRGWIADASSEKAIDTERSVLTVRVYKAGLFSSFGHDHEIRAPIKEGTFDEEKNTVQFIVEAKTLKVIDPGASDKERAEIQTTMLGPKVLDSEEFREIRFHSTEVTHETNDKWIVQGELALHGQTKPIKAEVERQNGAYRGSAQFRQKDFGITPVSVAGGSIKVKDEVRIEFEIVGK
jgi:polyisoprenoid-binding protein YceI